MQKYQLLMEIGKGTYGKVFKAINTETNEIVAVKRPRSQLIKKGIPPSALREISLLRALSKDPHIVKLQAVEHVRPWRGDRIPVEPESVNENNREESPTSSGIRQNPITPRIPRRPVPMLYLIFEHLDMDLKVFINEYRSQGLRFSPRLVKEFMFQLVAGLCFCHGHGVLHRDLKPQNILVDKKRSYLKIADFGLGREYSEPTKPYTSEVVTLWYRAPELLLGCANYSTPIDIWALGCIFAELVTTSPLFHAFGELEQLLAIFKELGTPTEAEWEGLKSLKEWNDGFPQWKRADIETLGPGLEKNGLDLLSKMLVCDPSRRISAQSALSHPYFKDL